MAEPDRERTERPREETKVSRHLILKWGPADAARAKAQDRVQSVQEWLRKLPRARIAIRILVGSVLFVVAVLALIGLSKALSDWGLWGDLAFAIIITTAALWPLLRSAGRLLSENPHFSPFGWALGLTTLFLVGLPIAVVTWPVGTMLGAIPIVVCLVGNLLRGRTRFQPPTFWESALLSVAALVAYVGVGGPLAVTDPVPRALPQAQLENADVAVARAFRPYLFFDTAEKRYPLDIEDAIDQGRISMCRAGVRGDDCPVLNSAAEIDDNFAYLQVADAPPPRRGGDDSSAYYFHVSRDGDTTYVDYWWFYARNPSPVAGGVFCGPGFHFPPYTCQEHGGDWEGITLILKGCSATAQTCVEVGGRLLTPAGVRYAQHEHVRPYGWAELQRRWRAVTRPPNPALGAVWDEFVLPVLRNHGVRPIVFVARNSHASYAEPCPASCSQIGRSLPEGRYDGGLPWSYNQTCSDCVKALPITTSGDAALWNAFSGRWGEQECILGGAYCDFSPAPRSPSHQGRYEHPGGWFAG
jgi:hypothetical protein